MPLIYQVMPSIPQIPFSLDLNLKDFPPGSLSSWLLLLFVQIYINVRDSARLSDLLPQKGGETVHADDKKCIFLKGCSSKNAVQHLFPPTPYHAK